MEDRPSTSLTDRILARDPRAIARAISLIEDESPDAARVVGAIYARTGRAYLVGITGPPGAGKSTLVDRLTAEWRKRGSTVGIVCVDPTSPFSGGAILGDRVRMQAHAEDAGVFIRSMATRGHLGGLAQTTAEAAIVLDAAGFDVVIIETVGVGQDEVDIVRTADVSVVTMVPGTGDEMQALKAGIMEIADIFVVNKADREGADRTAASIEAMLSLESFAEGQWRPPVLRTVATTGSGVAELVTAVEQFRTRTDAAVGQRRRNRAEWRLRELLGRGFLQHLERAVLEPGELDRLLDRVTAREIDPYAAADGIVRRALAGGASVPAPLDHVGIAVRDAAGFAALFAELFGLPTDEPEVVGPHRLRFVAAGGPTLELVEPVSDAAPVAKFLSQRGEALHHLCFRVSDIEATMASLREKGVRLIDEKPRKGAHGARIAFIHPSSAGGLLIEIKEIKQPAR
ncbi:MAG TPA: methylmalonyl Co-A mutase-associated GTPase MeaB [Vicinamibacterales bacterium]|nr:methylmalonyl Co-A mutase-associated GTPase MeaB [Vicinamibacterales bacterium]